MTIEHIILYVATNSKSCREPLQFVKATNFPLTLIRLDTAESRQRVSKPGKLRNVTIPPVKMVPTLCLINSGARNRLIPNMYVGPKVMQVLITIYNKYAAAQSESFGETFEPPNPVDRLNDAQLKSVDSPISHSHAVKTGMNEFQNSVSGRYRNTVSPEGLGQAGINYMDGADNEIEDDITEQTTQINFETIEPELEEFKMIESSGNKKQIRKKKKSKSIKVQRTSENIEPESIDVSGSTLPVKRTSQDTNDLMAKAKMMEKQQKSTWMYMDKNNN